MSVMEDSGTRSNPGRVFALVACFTLVESLVQLAGATVGILAYECIIPFKNGGRDTTVWQLTYIYYFSKTSCHNQFAINETSYELNSTNPAAKKTIGVLYTYAVLGCGLLLGSVLMLVSSRMGKKLGMKTGKSFHYCWAICMTFVLALDVIATILYLIDLVYTTKSDVYDLLKLTGMSTSTDNPEKPANKNLPPIIMAAFFSKGIVLWITNLICLIIINNHSKQFNMLRNQGEVTESHTFTSANMWPSKTSNTWSSGEALDKRETIFSLPRLVNRDGVVMSERRPTPLEIASTQGFNYEKPPQFHGMQHLSTTLDGRETQVPRIKLPLRSSTTYHGHRAPNNNQYNDQLHKLNILQKDNDVFY